MAVNVDVRVAEGVSVGRVVAVFEAVEVRLGVWVWGNVKDAVTLPSGVAVAVGTFVEVNDGASVGLGSAVEVGIDVEVAAGAKI